MPTIDARGKSCPLPIVLAAKALRAAARGAVFVIQADDRAFAADIRAWCAKTGNELVTIVDKQGYAEATVKKTAG